MWRAPTSAGDLVNPRITDCLPPGLDLLDPINPANPINSTATGFSVLPIIHLRAGGCGTNQNLITDLAGHVLHRRRACRAP